MVVQIILVKIVEDESLKHEGSYYRMIIKIKSKHPFIGRIIQILFFIALLSLLGMASLSYLK